jgi:hypothetical protein
MEYFPKFNMARLCTDYFYSASARWLFRNKHYPSILITYNLLIDKYNCFCTKTIQSNKSTGRAGPERSYLELMHKVIHRICGKDCM